MAGSSSFRQKRAANVNGMMHPGVHGGPPPPDGSGIYEMYGPSTVSQKVLRWGLHIDTEPCLRTPSEVTLSRMSTDRGFVGGGEVEATLRLDEWEEEDEEDEDADDEDEDEEGGGHELEHSQELERERLRGHCQEAQESEDVAMASVGTERGDSEACKPGAAMCPMEEPHEFLRIADECSAGAAPFPECCLKPDICPPDCLKAACWADGRAAGPVVGSSSSLAEALAWADDYCSAEPIVCLPNGLSEALSWAEFMNHEPSVSLPMSERTISVNMSRCTPEDAVLEMPAAGPFSVRDHARADGASSFESELACVRINSDEGEGEAMQPSLCGSPPPELRGTRDGAAASRGTAASEVVVDEETSSNGDWGDCVEGRPSCLRRSPVTEVQRWDSDDVGNICMNLDGSDANVRRMAVCALAEFAPKDSSGERAVEAAREHLADANPQVRRVAAEVLSLLGRPFQTNARCRPSTVAAATAPVTAAATSAATAAARAAATKATTVAAAAPPVSPLRPSSPLRTVSPWPASGSTSPQRIVSPWRVTGRNEAAASALTRVPAASGEVLAVMCAYIHDSDPHVRLMAIGAVPHVSRKGDKIAVDALIQCLDCDDDAEMRRVALGALAQVSDSDSVKAVTAMARRFADEDSRVRCAAVESMARVALRCDEELATKLAGRLNDPDAAVRKAASAALGEITLEAQL
eukprot:NODE_1509_length_2454_cov_2.290073.p1 GENE.NODE_1509_length_2454_cov_2.290073~~NODE_1509_length_2454_cov_2.290073.p1  ORF type:complete len:756 (-),score=199.06 NODE_1509_length_2454_cov_2.290073:186-2267(-)